jgi:hypothetical protein
LKFAYGLNRLGKNREQDAKPELVYSGGLKSASCGRKNPQEEGPRLNAVLDMIPFFSGLNAAAPPGFSNALSGWSQRDRR